MPLSQINFLLMLAEDAAIKGDEISEEWRQKAILHYQEVHELSRLIDRAKELIEREKVRFQQYAPQSQPRPQIQPQEGLPQHLARPALKKAAE